MIETETRSDPGVLRPAPRRRYGCTALVALLVALLVAVAPAGAATNPVPVPRGAIGVSLAYSQSGMDDYERWLGRETDIVHTFLNGQTWGQLAADAPGKGRGVYGDLSKQLLLSIPMRGSLRAGADGAYDTEIRAIARALVAAGRGDTIIRPGWELNGDWFTWSVAGQEEAYAAFFRRIVTVMRSVPGQRFVFDWCIVARRVSMAMYPGDDYVDIIGYDLYDESYSRSLIDPEARWRHMLQRPYGLNWLADFAAERGKPVSFPEWAVSTKHVPGVVTDNPLYVERMYEWMRTHDVAYSAYFERTAEFEYELTGATRFPRSAEAYRRLFGSAPPARTGPVQAPLTARAPAGTPAAAAPEPTPPSPAGGFPASTPSGQGVWVAQADGTVRTYGNAPDLGSLAGVPLSRPIVGLASNPSGRGYWMVGTDGGIFSFGDAPFLGSTGAVALNQPIVGIAPTPSGQGYWLVASDGGLFSFGDAGFFGSTGGTRLTAPVVGMHPTPSGQGYWLVASDGGVFAFGDAGFHGSTGDVRLNQPIVAISSTTSGQGYRFVAADGGVFTFGDAAFLGSAASRGEGLARVQGLVATPSGAGYWLATADGAVVAFGDATAFG